MGQYSEGHGLAAMWNMNGGQGQQMYPGGFGFDPSQAGFNGVDWSGAAGFNPMAIQNGMQNGMQGGDWNNYSAMMGKLPLTAKISLSPQAYNILIGMTGMNMGPVSQGMFGGYGGQGVGMNGMAGMNGMNGMNMGMGYGGGYGTGWNGQQMSSSDFGGANAGYYPGGGYNQSSQGHFPHQMHHQQQQFPKNNYQNQNRFHGQGAHQQKGFGRGQQSNFGSQNQTQGPSQNHMSGQNHISPGQNQPDQQEDDAFHHQLPMELQGRRASQQKSVEPSQPNPNTDAGEAQELVSNPTENHAEVTVPGHTTEYAENKEKGEDLTNIANASSTQDNITTEPEELTTVAGGATQEGPVNPDSNEQIQGLQPIATVDTSEPSAPAFDNSNMNVAAHQEPMVPLNHGQYLQSGVMNDFPHRGRGGMRGGYGRGAGFDFRGGFGGRGVQGGGFMPTGAFGPNNAILPQGGDVTVLTPGEPRGLGVEGAPTGPKAMREGRPNTGFVSRGRYPGPPPAVVAAPDPSVASSHSRPRRQVQSLPSFTMSELIVATVKLPNETKHCALDQSHHPDQSPPDDQNQDQGLVHTHDDTVVNIANDLQAPQPSQSRTSDAKIDTAIARLGRMGTTRARISPRRTKLAKRKKSFEKIDHELHPLIR